MGCGLEKWLICPRKFAEIAQEPLPLVQGGRREREGDKEREGNIFSAPSR